MKDIIKKSYDYVWNAVFNESFYRQKIQYR